MTAQLLDGKALAKTMQEEVSAEIQAFKEATGVTPKLVVVRAGEDPASVSYANAIAKTCEKYGVAFELKALPESASQAEMVSLVQSLSADASVHGIMVQEPMPKGIDPAAVIAALSPAKDVDGVHPLNAGLLMEGKGDFFAPATPSGGMEILRRYNVPIKGKHAVVVGRSNIVGKPMALLLLHEHATVTICHSRTVDLGAVTRQGDILVAAVGKARLITGDMVKPGAVVIDFGVNFEDGKMVGDVDFESAKEVAGMITPVPGGTGPMTNVMLMKNVLAAAKRQVSA
ncbi:MAG: bifunctional 5,10-methylenetetrahydrofolate dehydrogenase/5,10-methenyltetrahydrofolate cyclohydrolase [Anaerolineae bacterium]|nr:bifunctional 5,10-methylenetetrahydrofolate dehydrogenase/5,10-methenyltetrahydrofolate cyclohydrolase [Anaerolineae bacterium]